MTLFTYQYQFDAWVMGFESSVVWELHGVGVHCVGIAMCGGCGVWELRCVGVAVLGV